ncbi:Nn.00g058710.m01.CDS01 [Neocucurbitaria sp. VM-36]
MKITYALSTLMGLSSAAFIPRQADCLGVTGVRADLTNPNQGGPAPFKTISGKGNLAACREECFSVANAQCQTFSIRENQSSGGACYLYDSDVSSKLKPNTASTYVYYALPAGIQGWVPENVAQHYKADTSKTKGSYTACRALCLSETQCKGFGYKAGGNCQLYDVSLRGKISPTTASPYIQHYADCNGAGRGPVQAKLISV